MTKGIKTVPITDTSLSSSLKERMSFEEELILPDYCPDIENVIFLKCRSRITSVSEEKNEITVSGLTFLNLCYESDDGRITNTEYSLPFGKNIPLKDELFDPKAFFKIENSSESFKLISKRRLSARGSFYLEGEVFDLRQKEAAEKSEDRDIILKREKFSFLVPYDSLNEIISSQEELLLPEGKKEIGEIIDTEAEVMPEKCFFKDGKLCLKGSVFLHVIYVPQENEDTVDSFDVVIPIDKIWEDMELQENFIIKPLLTPISLSLNKSQEVIKEDGKLIFEGEFSCRMLIFAPSERLLATDGFSSLYEYKKEEENIRFLKSCEDINISKALAGDIPASSDMREICDCSSSVKSISIIDEEGISAFCDVKFSVLFKNADDKYKCTESTIRCTLPIPGLKKGDFIFCEPFIKDTFAGLSNGKLKLSCSLVLSGFIIKTETETLLKDIETEKEKKLPGSKGFSMVIYYADKTDSLWDISKKYKVDPERVKDENSLKSEEFEERTPLIIPL